jgi:hypothetical protein
MASFLRQPSEKIRQGVRMAAVARQRRSPLGLFPDKPAPRLHDRMDEVLRAARNHCSRGKRGTTEVQGSGGFVLQSVGALKDSRPFYPFLVITCPKELSLQYAAVFKVSPTAMLFNTDGLPAAPFRKAAL